MLYSQNGSLLLPVYESMDINAGYYYQNGDLILPIPSDIIKTYHDCIREIPSDLRYYLFRLIDTENIVNDPYTPPLRCQYLEYLGFVIVAFIKQEYKISLQIHKFNIPKHWSKSFKNLIMLEASLLSKTLKLLKLLSYDYTINIYEYFIRIVLERQLMFICFDCTGKKFTSTGYLRNLQNENNKLFRKLNGEKYVNCFDQKIFPYTYKFLDICLKEESRNSTFAKEYRELGKIRMRYVTSLRNQQPYVYTNDGLQLEHRGRNKSSQRKKC